jgi:hypothetical protein
MIKQIIVMLELTNDFISIVKLLIYSISLVSLLNVIKYDLGNTITRPKNYYKTFKSIRLRMLSL